MYLKDISLKSYNTFGVEAKAQKFISIDHPQNFEELFTRTDWQNKFYILAGGSNVLFTGDFEGTIIWINNKGINILKETAEEVWVEVAAGEEWDDFVKWCVSQNFGGIENMGLIPGKCGSSAVQNIGAYGVEAKDTIYEVRGLEIPSGEKRVLYNSECQFNYRYSIFKGELKNKVLITSVVYKLSKNAKPKLNYHSLVGFLTSKNIQNPSINDVYEAVCEIRREKLPDHKEIANAGSFFKNPIIEPDFFEELKLKHSDLVFWELPNGKIKLAAGQLIEKCGWKGKRIGDAGVYEKQALVLVNHGKASGKEMYDLAKTIIQDVSDIFGIILDPEVIIL
ncbi:MAG: UDP-N-acetylmuramate dehydrogenase [Bacteroidales bacterium]|nr:UDP-N-acetylmuramate dehydrogenase [Bacteroidales bacterium]MDY0216817.1 UDP-N-acetylmuramate dehydrogenase [Bacteroidales bacterium]